jgi:hypothetical protein
MLKREITYEDFNGEKATDTYYFNLTKTEIITLEVSYEGGLEAALKRIVDTKDSKNLIAEFKRIILLAYGVKSEDGKRFIKSDQLRDEFSQTAAYDALFMELATNDEAAAVFIKGIIPKDMAQEAAKSEVSVLPLPPQPPKG